MSAKPFEIKVPWWAVLLGAVRRWKRDRQPVYRCTVAGECIWLDGSNRVETTHHYDLFETPRGVRTYKLRKVREWTPNEHVIYSNIILPWLHRRIEIDYASCIATNGKNVRGTVNA